MTPDDEPARSGYATETFFAGRAGGMVVSRYAVMENGTLVQVMAFGGEQLLRVVVGAGPGVYYVASPRSVEAVERGECGAIAFPTEDVSPATIPTIHLSLDADESLGLLARLLDDGHVRIAVP